MMTCIQANYMQQLAAPMEWVNKIKIFPVSTIKTIYKLKKISQKFKF
jgi:hypothetical protein